MTYPRARIARMIGNRGYYGTHGVIHMTSKDTWDTFPHCATCPGRDRCLRAAGKSLVSAYKKGCRTPETRAANTAYARATRAGEYTPAAKALPGEWQDAENPTERELTGETCECGLSLYWEVGHAAQICDNGHWRNAPGTRERIAQSTRERKQTESPPNREAEITARMRDTVSRQKAIEHCDNLLKWFDPSNYLPNTWHIQLANEMRLETLALRQEISRADDSETLRIVINMVSQLVARFQGYRVQLLTEIKRVRELSQVPAASTVRELPPAETYDDNDDDKYSTRRNDYADDDAIINAADNVGVQLASAWGNYRNMRTKQKEENGECYFKAWHRIWNDDLASRWVIGLRVIWSGQHARGQEQINICSSKRCLERADNLFRKQGYDDCEYGDL